MKLKHSSFGVVLIALLIVVASSFAQVNRPYRNGSVWDIAFSRDPDQRYLYLADGKNERVYIIERKSLKVLTSFGDGGRQPGRAGESEVRGSLLGLVRTALGVSSLVVE